jgi:hypothetical protein
VFHACHFQNQHGKDLLGHLITKIIDKEVPDRYADTYIHVHILVIYLYICVIIPLCMFPQHTARRGLVCGHLYTYTYASIYVSSYLYICVLSIRHAAGSYLGSFLARAKYLRLQVLNPKR